MSTLTAYVSPSIPAEDLEPSDAELERLRYENWLENTGGIERIDGVILEKPVAKKSGLTESRINGLLLAAGDREDGWDVYSSSVGYKTDPQRPENFRKPDVSAVRRSRLAEDADEGFFHIPADLAVEVVSPNDGASDMIAKVLEYLTHGVQLVWVVDPDSRSVLVFRKGTKQMLMLDEADEIDGGDVLPGLKCKVAQFFGRAT